jgi:hypothetical protein
MKLELSRNFYTQVAGYAARVQECFPIRCFPSYLISDKMIERRLTPQEHPTCRRLIHKTKTTRQKHSETPKTKPKGIQKVDQQLKSDSLCQETKDKKA